MRKCPLAVAVSGILVAMSSAGAQSVVRDSMISVTQQRTSRVLPDRVSFFVIVDGTAETAPDAVARVETKLQPVVAALRGLGSLIEADRPIGYSVGPAPGPIGYPVNAVNASQLARSVIHVQLTRVDQITKVIATALAAGASTASGFTFEATGTDSIRRSRVAEAIGAARAEAEVIARSLGVRLGDVADVTTSASPFGFNSAQFSLDNRISMPTPVPEVAINVSVTVRYHMIR